MKLSRIIAVLFVVFLVLVAVAYVTAVSTRKVNTLYGDEPLSLDLVYTFLVLAAIFFVGFLVSIEWERSRAPSTAPAHFAGEDDRGPGEVRTRVRDGEVKRIGGKW
jgi:hypothetical protein